LFIGLQETSAWQQAEQGQDHLHQPAGNMVGYGQQQQQE
jgi:hypothetical protein